MKRKLCRMRLRNRFVLSLVPLALVLAGCFQQAGTALQEPISITNQAVQVVPATSVPLPTRADTTASGSNNGQGQDLSTPTLNLLPDAGSTGTTTNTGNTDAGNPPVALTIISATLPPQVTEVPQTIPTDAGGQTTETQGTPAETQFITPSSPLGPVTQVPILSVTNVGEPTSTPSGLVTPTAFSAVDTGGGCTHTIQSGDTLYRIAVKYNITVTQLRSANPQVSGDIIQPGDVLKIPGCSPNAGGNTGNVTQPTTAPSVPATALPGGSQTYVVKRGDTLYTIGLKFGVTADAIQKANNISNPNRINPGQELVIPPKSG